VVISGGRIHTVVMPRRLAMSDARVDLPEPEVPPKRRMTHLPSSVAIRGHQWCHQWSSEVISSHQWKCVIIRGSPAVINGHQWSSEVIVVINGHQRSSTVLISDQRTVAAP